MPHQLEAMRRAREQDGQVGFYMAPGTGKTLPAIRHARIYSPVLCIMRSDDILTWLIELGLENEHDITVIESRDTLLPETPTKWTLVTYDLVKDPDIFNWILDQSFGVAIADEVHLLKRYKSQRTKDAIAATRHILRRIGMTGSPLTNQLTDPFSTSLFIDNGRTFGNNFWRYQRTYFIQSGPGWYPKRSAKQAIGKKLGQLAYVVHEDDVLKLPPKRYVLKGVPQSGQQRKAYERLLNEWEYEIDGQVVELDYVVAQIQKLRQVASGFLYDEHHNARWMRCHKLTLLQDLLTDENYLANEPKIVVWAAHSAEIERIAEMAEKIDRKAVLFYGKQKRLKNAARTTFFRDPATEIFIGQSDSGIGINELRVARTAMYYSNSYRVVSRQQSERRIRRRGSEHHSSITYWDLVTRGTIDETIYHGLQEKIDIAENILAQIRNGQQLRRILASRLTRCA